MEDVVGVGEDDIKDVSSSDDLLSVIMSMLISGELFGLDNEAKDEVFEDVVVAVLEEGMYGMGIAKLRGVWVVLSEYRSSSLGLDFFIVKM